MTFNAHMRNADLHTASGNGGLQLCRPGVAGAGRVSLHVALSLIFITVCASGCEDSRTGPRVNPAPDWGRPAYQDPIWSPDGSRIGFNHRPLDSIYADTQGRHHYVFNDSLLGFWMIDSSGLNLRRVLTSYLDDPAWSPDGAWIAYGRNSDIWKIRTDLIGIDSASGQQLTFQGIYFGPAWDPNSQTLLFYRPSGAVTGIYRIGAGGGAPEHIGGSGWRDPNWSPDRLKFLFTGTVGSEYGVGSSDTTGAGATIIHPSPAIAQLPKWSPDGSTIAFIDRDPATQVQHLWIMNADGSNLRKASPDAVGHGFSWAPDGTRIAYLRFSFTEHTYENGTIWVVDVGSGALRQLTFSGPGAP